MLKTTAVSKGDSEEETGRTLLTLKELRQVTGINSDYPEPVFEKGIQHRDMLRPAIEYSIS